MAVERRNTKRTLKTKSLNNTFGIWAALYTLEQRNTVLKISSCTLCKFNTLNTHGNDQILVCKILHININLNTRDMTKTRNLICTLKHTIQKRSLLKMDMIHTLNKKLSLIIFLCGVTQEMLPDTANIINNRHHSRKVSRSRSTKSPYIIILAGQLDMRHHSNTVRNISITAATNTKELIRCKVADIHIPVLNIDHCMRRMLNCSEKLGYKLDIMDIEFGAILGAVSSGKADFTMAGLTVTDERKQSVDFSTSYATGIQSIVVKEDSPITSVDDLYADGADYQIGVQQDTTGDIYCSDDFGDDHVQRFNKGADAVAALVSGKLDCVVIDNEPAKSFVAANEGLKVLDTAYAVEDYAAAFAKGSELTEPFNKALEELIADGTVQKIVDKYISAN